VKYYHSLISADVEMTTSLSQKQRRRKLIVHSAELYENDEDTFEDVRAELKATSFNLV